MPSAAKRSESPRRRATSDLSITSNGVHWTATVSPFMPFSYDMPTSVAFVGSSGTSAHHPKPGSEETACPPDSSTMSGRPATPRRQNGDTKDSTTFPRSALEFDSRESSQSGVPFPSSSLPQGSHTAMPPMENLAPFPKF